MRVPTYGGQKVQASGLPSVYQQGGATPQDFGAGQGRQLAEFGAALGDAWDKKQQADGDAFAAAAISKADLDNTQRFVDLQSKMPAGADGFTDAYLKEHDDYFSQVIASTDNPYARKKLEQHALNSREAYGKQAIVYQAQEGVRNRSQQFLEASDNEAKMILDMNGTDAEQYTAKSIERSDSEIDAQPLPPDQKQKLKDEARARKIEAAWQTKLRNPDELLKPKAFPGGFDNAMDVVEKNEGGFTAIDGSSGAPAIYGINRKWHPEAFDKAKALTDSQGEAAGKAYAREFYKKEFWDKNGIEGLPKETQLVVLDGVINHTSSFGSKLVEAAKNGASPAELASMRRGEYQRLATANPEKYGKDLKGWMSRMDRVEASSMFGSLGKYMTADQQIKAANQAQKVILDDHEKFMKDTAAWGEKRGMSPQQIVQVQAERGTKPFYANVIGKETAKNMALKISQAQTPDEIMNMATQLKSQYGEYTENAIRDLKVAGLKPAHEAALMLAASGGQYGEQIDLLSKVGIVGDTVLNAEYKDLGYDEKVLREEMLAQTESYMAVKALEDGDGGANVAAEKDVIMQLAKAKMNMSRDGDYKAAVEFAIKSNSENYKVASLNGVEYRLPTRARDGNVYDTSELESRVNSAYLELLPKIAKENAKDSYLLKYGAIPVLNDTKDGIELLVPGTMAPLVDANGNRYELKFDDLVSKESFQERMDRIRKDRQLKPETKQEQRKREQDLTDMFGRE